MFVHVQKVCACVIHIEFEGERLANEGERLKMCVHAYEDDRLASKGECLEGEYAFKQYRATQYHILVVWLNTS